ncbi:hypothetical protein D3C73_869430 [compost metagenome]
MFIMKKFLAGIIVGVGVSVCSVTLASESLQAFLFPSKVTFHSKSDAREILFSDNDPVINYNNKTYIPLRLFSEALDAKVHYSPPTASSDHKNVIDIYLNPEDDISLQDTDNYVSIQHFDSKSTDEGIYVHTNISGLLQVNQSLEGKIIEIHALNAEQQMIGSTADIYMEGPALLNVGETRKLQTAIITKEFPTSYAVLVKDTWGLTIMHSYTDGMIMDIAGIAFGPPNVDSDNKALISSLSFKNTIEQDILIEPMNIELQINKIDGESSELIKSYKLPTLKGRVPAEAWYKAVLPPWDLRDQNGKPAAPGKYEIQIIVPSSLDYTYDGSTEIKTITNLARIKKWDFEINQDHQIVQLMN